MRVFVGIEFPDEVIKEVARIQEQVEKWKFSGKLTELENIHLTLKFLGEIDEKKLKNIESALRNIRFSAFEAKLDKIGIFSYKGNPRIVWVKVAGKFIFELQKKVDEALEGIFSKEERFMSHMTIARVKYVTDKSGFAKYINNLSIKKIKFRIQRFFLKSSELMNSGPVYKNLSEFMSG